MGYRLPEERSHLEDVARQSRITVDNGVISHFSIPCYYKVRRGRHGRMHRMIHDHLGWPVPDSPDDSCQLHHGHHHHHCDLVPIDLIAEGYEAIIVSLVDPPNGLYFGGVIDGNTVLLKVYPMCDDAVTKDVEVQFCVYAVGGEWDSLDDDEPTPMDDSSTENEGSSEASSGTSSDIPSDEGTSEADPSATNDDDDDGVPDEAVKKPAFRDVVTKGILHIIAGPIR